VVGGNNQGQPSGQVLPPTLPVPPILPPVLLPARARYSRQPGQLGRGAQARRRLSRLPGPARFESPESVSQLRATQQTVEGCLAGQTTARDQDDGGKVIPKKHQGAQGEKRTPVRKIKNQIRELDIGSRWVRSEGCTVLWHRQSLRENVDGSWGFSGRRVGALGDEES
jgi:hypothetical protein